MNQPARKRHLVSGMAPRFPLAVRSQKTILWRAAAATAFAAVFFPHLEAVKNEDQPVWEFWPHDREGTILVPLIILITLALFALLGRWAWSDTSARNRPAKVGLVCGLLGLVGVLAFGSALRSSSVDSPSRSAEKDGDVQQRKAGAPKHAQRPCSASSRSSSEQRSGSWRSPGINPPHGKSAHMRRFPVAGL